MRKLDFRSQIDDSSIHTIEEIFGILTSICPRSNPCTISSIQILQTTCSFDALYSYNLKYRKYL